MRPLVTTLLSARRTVAIACVAACVLGLDRCAQAPPPTGSSTLASSSAMPAGVDVAAIDRVLGGWATGSIPFNVMSTMRLGETYPIHLLLSRRKSVQALQQELQTATHEGTVQGAQISIAPEMEARLTGQGFEITAVTPERQTVSAEANTD